MTNIAEMKGIAERLEQKMNESAIQMATHMAVDQANTEKLSKLWSDVHGDGNGKRGIRRELDDVKYVMRRYESLSGLITAAVITSVITSVITVVVGLIIK